VLQLVWDEMNLDADNEVFLQHCYIAPEPSEDMLRVARELLEQRRATDDMLASAIEHADPRKVLALRGRSEKERPVVVLGRIGHGKSTFLKYLRHVEAKDILQNKYIQSL
jgi:ATPase subunit of ABC transporter with duplicated ATPase domains